MTEGIAAELDRAFSRMTCDDDAIIAASIERILREAAPNALRPPRFRRGEERYIELATMLDGDHVELVKRLREHGAAITNGAASAAIEFENPRILEFLLDEGIDANARRPNGETLLMYAARLGNMEAVEILTGKGADVDALLEVYPADGVRAFKKASDLTKAPEIRGYLRALEARTPGRPAPSRTPSDDRLWRPRRG